MIREQLIQSFTSVALSPDPDLAVAALMIARIEYPDLQAGPYLDELDALGREAARRVVEARALADTPDGADPHAYARVMALNDFLFREQRFVGNDRHYEDPRNSFLNEVLDRRTGIPITLALVYIEVARRAGVMVEGVNFPGHFLVRCRASRESAYRTDLIIDAHHGGALLSEEACRSLQRRYAGEEAEWDPDLLVRATKPQILSRMLVNLKRVYVRMHSFPQARDIADLLVAMNPSSLSELRDRGLLAYQMNDWPAALRDLQTFLRFTANAPIPDADRDEQSMIWDCVKTVRRRIASLN
jgi:regulator of sirC expression with transglutaminase-like and TPR domain